MLDANKPEITEVKFEDSIYQKAIFDCLQNKTCHLIINAKAGSGKTTTIVRGLKLIPKESLTIFLAFNKSIVRELKARVPEHVYVSTLHGWGWKELMYKFGKNIILDEAKVSKIIQSLCKDWTDVRPEDLEGYCTRVEKLVDICRFALPQSREELLELCEKHDVELMNGEIDRAKEVLLKVRQDTKSFDFTDMIYFPAFHPTMKLRKFKFLFVDECQDLNAAQHKMIQRMVDPNGGRMVAVGDPNQSIYGFAGADINSYNNLKNLFPNTEELPLSFSYRCGSSIIEHAQKLVPEILPSPTAIEGSVHQGSYRQVAYGDFVLCRNTRPLVSLCMKYIIEGKKATIKGGDIGKNLINMIKRTKAKTQVTLFKSLDADREKLMKKMKEIYPFRDIEKVSQVVNMTDKIEALRAIGDNCKTKSTDEMIQTIQSIFAEEIGTGIILSTMHKSKGLEADNVFILEAQLVPAVYATQQWQKDQELNLDYVARTRAKKNLVYIADYVSNPDHKEHLAKRLNDLNIAA